MADPKRPSTPEEIMALPLYGIDKVQLVSDENCEIRYRGRVIRTSEPNTTINIPVMPSERAQYIGPDDIMFAVDEGGYKWAPILTEHGWVRRSLPDPRSWEENS